MAQNLNSDDMITLICTELFNSDADENRHVTDPEKIITISTAGIETWNLPEILAHKFLKIQIQRNRLVEESSYFRGLLSGSFSESGLDSISVHWNVEEFVSVLRVVFGCHVEISSDNFIPLNEAALFFGVDTLLLKCRVWLDEVTSFRGLQSPELCLDDLICIWKYGLEHANDFILQLCTSYLARNFIWALSFESSNDIPDKLFYSCIQHPDLTVDSERHLCDAIQIWLTANPTEVACWSSSFEYLKIRASLLPLSFAAGKRRCRVLSKFADKATATILSLARHPVATATILSLERHPVASVTQIPKDDLSQLRVRITKYTQRLDISGCPQITPGLFLLSVLPTCSADSMLRKIMKKSPINHAVALTDDFQISKSLGQMLTFEGVQEIDISNSPSFSLDSVMDCFCKSFPSLRTLRAAYNLNFKTKELCQLVQNLPLLTNIDLTLDVIPVIPAQVSITSSSRILAPTRSTTPYGRQNGSFTPSSSYVTRSLLSSITKLSLEGRTDFRDYDLLIISGVCPSLSYVNLKGCISVTDCGISELILNCKMLQSVLACDTSFGNKSILALCSGVSRETQQSQKQRQLTAYKLLTLHIGGCYGVDGKILSELMSGAGHLRSLCLREIQLVDDALYKFSGESLELLDVSDTKVSHAALSPVIRRNPNLKSVKTRGCSHLLQEEIEIRETKSHVPLYTPVELYSDLGETCELEEIELGWGFSFFSIGALKPAIRTLRTLVVSLGGSLGHDGLKLLPSICPLLEKLTLCFQVISNSALTNITKTLPHLQVLALCYCFGDISSFSFNFSMPNLRTLKLERVAPWMSNAELGTLAESCVNLTELSLIGCTMLDSESQAIISSRWPGLTSLYLEECGEITANGVTHLLDCHALEDLTLRHTGCGIPRNFITDTASKLPMLRKISIDICDAREGDFDIPSFDDRCFLSVVKIARCKLRKCTLDLQTMEPRRSRIHEESLVLVWNSEKLTRTVVQERL